MGCDSRPSEFDPGSVRALRTSDERFLAQKMLFLLDLASAKWIGELHTFSHRIFHSRDWGEVSFTFIAGFVTKTRDPSSSAPRFLGLRDLLYRPYQTRAQITVGDCSVPCGRSGVTWTALLHITLDVSGCSSPQDVIRRRSLKTRSPSGSGRRYLGRTSSRGGPFWIPLRELGRPEVLLRLFCVRRTSLSTRCLRRIHGAGTPPSRVITLGTLRIGP